MELTTDNALLNVRKTARLLDVHPNTLRNWANQGRLPCYTVNSRGDRRFRIEDIEDFLARHRRAEIRPDAQSSEGGNGAKTGQKTDVSRLASGYLDAYAAHKASA